MHCSMEMEELLTDIKLIVDEISNRNTPESKRGNKTWIPVKTLLKSLSSHSSNNVWT